MDQFTLKPIGYVKNDIPKRKDMNTVGVPSKIIINDEYLLALEYLKENSHIIVMCFFHEAKRDILQVYPRKFGVSHRVEKGVFATRSPDRPNPVAITITRLLDVRGNEIFAEKIDCISGTPVIDIKPYSHGSDAIYNCQSLNVKTDFVNPTDEMIYEYIKLGALNYIHETDDSFEFAIITLLKIVRTLNKMPDRELLDSIETDFTGNALDIIYYYSRFTPGENKITLTTSDVSKNTYVKLTLKTGQTLEVARSGNIDSVNILDVNKR